jgi:hypothetical protein
MNRMPPSAKNLCRICIVACRVYIPRLCMSLSSALDWASCCKAALTPSGCGWRREEFYFQGSNILEASHLLQPKAATHPTCVFQILLRASEAFDWATKMTSTTSLWACWGDNTTSWESRQGFMQSSRKQSMFVPFGHHSLFYRWTSYSPSK